MEGSYEIDTLNLITFSMNMFGGKFKNNGYGSTNMLNAQKEHAYSYNTLSRNERNGPVWDLISTISVLLRKKANF